MQKVFFEGENVVYEKYEYYVLNKPAGVISATKDNFHKTVIDILNVKRKGLAPVGKKYAVRFMLDPPRPPHWGGYRLEPDC